MLPVWESVRDEYGDRLSAVYLEERNHGLLAKRYNVQEIPTLLFFDKAGKEVHRHQGFLPQGAVERKLGELGVRKPL